ncbi:MAG TPA: ankyrin repeat domain-containing protein [Phycisphaerales bacterium]|nr:ankyrin repeat domain-containing protein [Phycisphaerales bacterium]HMP37602.1 ankyrin repeat domain-containing protein [Phycisphaerales bacterium]
MHRSNSITLRSPWRRGAMLVGLAGLLAAPAGALAAGDAPPVVPQRVDETTQKNTTTPDGRAVLSKPTQEEIEARRAAAREALRNRPTPNVDPNLRLDPDRAAAAAAAAEARAAGAAQLAPVTESLVIRLEPAELDLGEMVADIAKTGTVKVTNITDQPITIAQLIPSCGCTTAPAPRDPIAPGASVEIPMTLKPGSRQGVSLAKKVTFRIDGHPPVVYTIKGDVAEYVRIEPELITSNVEDPSSGKITLTSRDGQAFRILGVNPAVITDFSDEPALEHVVNIDWEKWQQTGSGVKLAIAIDHPKIPSVSAMIKRPIVRGQQEEVTARNVPDRQAMDPATTALVAAARRGDLAGISAAMAEGAKVDEADRLTGRTALHWAAREGQVDAIGELVKAGASLRSIDRTGKTPLGGAAEAGKAEAVKALLAAGSEIDHRDVIRGTALLWAAGLGNTETVKVLLAAGADPNAVDVNGLTPLLWAVGIGEPATVAALLDAKADPKIADFIDGDNALIRAARSGKDESLKILLARGVATDAKNNNGATALLVAAGSGSMEKIKALVQAKADPTVVDNSGRGVMDYARNRTDPARDAVVAYLTEIVGK